jgi:hypothetical protein
MNAGLLPGCAAGDLSKHWTTLVPRIATVSTNLQRRDAGGHIIMKYLSGSSLALTIPGQSMTAFPFGTVVCVSAPNGLVTLTPGTGVTLRKTWSVGTGSISMASGSVATLVRVEGAEWLVSGIGLT